MARIDLQIAEIVARRVNVDGASVRTVAAEVGMHYVTVSRIAKRGRNGEPLARPTKAGRPVQPPRPHKVPEVEAREMAELVEDLVSLADVAREFQRPRYEVARAVSRLGIDPWNRDLAKALQPTLVSMAKGMKPLHAAAALVDFVVAHWPEQDMEAIEAVMAHGFTQQEAQLLLALDSRQEGVSNDALHARVAWKDESDLKLTDVVASRVRAKLKKLGWPLRVVTVWGWGKKLVCDDPDWTMPVHEGPRRARLAPSVR